MSFGGRTLPIFVSLALLTIGVSSSCAGSETLEAQNRAPVASAGDDRTAAPGDVVMLDGSASFDPDQDDLIYRWELEKPEGSAASLTSANFVETTFQPDLSGTYTVTLIVSDGALDSPPDRVEVTVEGTGGNRPPSAEIVGGPTIDAAVGVELVLDASPSNDPDGDELRFDWSLDGRPNGSVIDLLSAGGAEARLTPDVAGTYEVSLVVDDGDLSSPPVTVIVNAREGVDVPVAAAGNDRSVSVGDEVTLDGTASQGTDLSYAWSLVRAPIGSDASLASTDGATTTLTPDAEGEYEVRLVVTSGGVSSAPDSAVITATSTGNRAPTANAGADFDAMTYDIVTLDGSASSDPDGDPLTYSWSITSSPANSIVSLDDATISGPAFLPDRIGDYVFELSVSDGTADATDSVTVTVTGGSPARSGDLLITEFLADAADDSTEEWFEIYNPSDIDWDLDGCVLSDDGTNSVTIGESVEVLAGTYVTLARSANPGFTPDVVYGNGFALANGGDEIIITCTTEIDRIAYNSTDYPYAESVSMQLQQDQYDAAGNDLASSWCVGTATYGASGYVGTPGSGPDCN